MAIAILAALVFVPAILIFLLKSNGAWAFLFLCGGIVLQSRLSADFWSNLSSNFSNLSHSANFAIALIVLPPLLAVLLLSRSVKRSKFVLHVVPSLCLGLLLAFTVVPYLPDGSLSHQIVDSSVWNQTHTYQGYVVAVGLLTSLLLAVVGKPKHKDDKKHH